MTFKEQSIGTLQFKNYFIEFIIGNCEDYSQILSEINWNEWLYEPGYPPYTLDYDIPAINAPILLAKA
jgi:hypothetical protein